MESIALTPLHRDTSLTDYIPVPRILFALNLPESAMLLYGLLLRRGLRSRLADGCDRVYVVYTVEQLAEALGVQPRSIQRNLNHLEGYGLVRRTRPVGNRASHIFLNIPAVSERSGPTGQPGHPSVTDSSGSSCPKRHTNKNTKKDNNKYLYLYDQEDSL